jgi:hypothetical protein
MGGHGGRRPGRRAGARVVVTAVVVLVAAALLAGVGAAATPLLAGTPAGPAADSLLGGLSPDDAGDIARDGGIPVPDLPPCLPTVRACVDLAGDQAWLLDKGQVVRGPVPIIPGADDDPTPRGSFTVQWKAAEYTSREFLVQMPWAVFFADGGIAFHEGDPDTYSAGCVKLDEDDARAFFQFLHVGDPVQVV